MAEARPRAVLYYRDGCHLCEQMAAWLRRGWPTVAAETEWRDVDRSSEWRRLYGDRIPVLAVGDDVLCESFPDAGRVREVFGAPAHPL